MALDIGADDVANNMGPAAGFAAVSWPTMSAIAASCVISPVLGGTIAAGFLWLIKAKIIYTDDKIAAARKWVPILVGIIDLCP